MFTTTGTAGAPHRTHCGAAACPPDTARKAIVPGSTRYSRNLGGLSIWKTKTDMSPPITDARIDTATTRRESFMSIMALETGGVVAAVYEGDFAGDSAGEVAGEEEGGVADFELIYVAVERGTLLDCGEDAGEVADAAGGEGLDGASGDGVDADLLRAEVGGEVADDGLKRGLGGAHDVVV